MLEIAGGTVSSISQLHFGISNGGKPLRPPNNKKNKKKSQQILRNVGK